MDRQIVYPGSIPLDTDLLTLQRNVMVALGYLAQATLGTSPVVDGLACSPTSPASLTVTIGPGSVCIASVVDPTNFGSLPADVTDPLVKMGVNAAPTTFTLSAPAVSGQSTNYLIQANLIEVDSNPVVLPYYNATNPAQPFSGPANAGSGQNTQRLQRVQLQLKPGAPANAGTQVTPPIDNGWIGLYIITVNFGQTQLTAASISTLPTAPFVPFKLAALAPGFSRMATFTASAPFVVPAGVQRLKVRLCGAGGGGGAGASNLAGGGGGSGGYAEGVFPVSPGISIPITVGSGGGGGFTGSATAAAGTFSAFGIYLNATGGSGGASAAAYSPGGSPGSGSGGAVNLTGGYGGDGSSGSLLFTGNGGASYFGGGGRAAASGGNAEQNGAAPGAGGGGCYGIAGNGGSGAPGIVIVEF